MQQEHKEARQKLWEANDGIARVKRSLAEIDSPNWSPGPYASAPEVREAFRQTHRAEAEKSLAYWVAQKEQAEQALSAFKSPKEKRVRYDERIPVGALSCSRAMGNAIRAEQDRDHIDIVELIRRALADRYGLSDDSPF